jgi:hypothetical protein
MMADSSSSSSSSSINPQVAAAAAEERRTQQQHKRIKLFHAMRDSASADVLPALQECHYPQFYQFALAMEQMLHTWALERGAPGDAETTRAAALAVIRMTQHQPLPFATQVRAAVDADAAYGAWPWRTTLMMLTPPNEEPLVERVVLSSSSSISGTSDNNNKNNAVPGAPCYRLRILGPYARTCLVEVGWDFVDPARVVQRDSVYQSLVFLLGLLSRHPLFKETDSSEAALARIQQKRELARSSLQSSVERSFASEKAKAREQVEQTRAELEALRGDGAEAERVNAVAALAKASASVERCMSELEQTRLDASTHFVEDTEEAATRAEWLALCGERQRFWARELNRARAREEKAKAKAQEARSRVEEAAQRIERLEEWLWSTTTCPFLRGGNVTTLLDHVDVTRGAMIEVDAYFDAFVPLAAWVDERLEHMETLRAWIQHEDVVLDGHLTAVRRSEAMLRSQ